MSYYGDLAARDLEDLTALRDSRTVPAGYLNGLIRRGLVTVVMGSYLLTDAGKRRLAALEET